MFYLPSVILQVAMVEEAEVKRVNHLRSLDVVQQSGSLIYVVVHLMASAALKFSDCVEAIKITKLYGSEVHW